MIIMSNEQGQDAKSHCADPLEPAIAMGWYQSMVGLAQLGTSLPITYHKKNILIPIVSWFDRDFPPCLSTFLGKITRLATIVFLPKP